MAFLLLPEEALLSSLMTLRWIRSRFSTKQLTALPQSGKLHQLRNSRFFTVWRRRVSCWTWARKSEIKTKRGKNLWHSVTLCTATAFHSIPRAIHSRSAPNRVWGWSLDGWEGFFAFTRDRWLCPLPYTMTDFNARLNKCWKHFFMVFRSLLCVRGDGKMNGWEKRELLGVRITFAIHVKIVRKFQMLQWL